MELRDLQDHLDGRLDRLEDKIDNHLERISKAEADIGWLRGHARVIVTLLMGTLSGLALAVYQLITGKG